MAKKSVSRLLVGIASIILLCNNCNAQEKEILIGEFGSLTGQIARFGQSAHSGMQLAIEEANAHGGIHGKQIKLITEDDQSKPEDATMAVHGLIDRFHVVAVLGEVASSRSRAG